MAERGVLRTAHSAEASERKRAIGAQFAALLKAAEQRIIAHVQGKIAAINPTLSFSARQAAIEQLIAEQTAALLQLRQDIKQQRRHARRAAGASLRGRFKRRRRSLAARHAVEREVTRAAFGARDVIWQRPARAFPAIRRMIPRLKLRAGRRPSVMRPRR
ncbi:MAG: hypothetical protein ACLPPF_21225 [Rhodomicrobium sp.]